MTGRTRRVAIVTGGARGIGRAIAARLSAQGADVVIADLHGATEAAAQLSREGRDAIGVHVDVGAEHSIEAMVRCAVERFGRVDVLVNNAGIFSSLVATPFTELTSEDWRTVFEVNVLGVFHCCRAVAGPMSESGGGRIINIASAAPLKGLPYFLHYISSKGAVLAMTRGLAGELADRHILVNAVAPGFTVSDGVQDNTALLGSMRGSAVRNRLIHRDQKPEDVAGMVAFLAGPDSGFVTGQTFVVDGGSVLH